MAEQAPKKPERTWKFISISHNYAGELHALTDEGRIFRYIRDPNAINVPGIHYCWQEVKGPE